MRRLCASASARWRSGNDGRSTPAAHDLTVDENILALVDWDVVAVLVRVVTPAALVVVDGERVGGRRGQGDNSQGANECNYLVKTEDNQLGWIRRPYNVMQLPAAD